MIGWTRTLIPACLMLVTGCDAVKVPVVNPTGDGDDRASATRDDTATVTPAAAPPPPRDTSDLAGGVDTPEMPAVIDLPPRERVTTLRAINAVQCGLGAAAVPTPTVATRADAVTGPQPESFTIQAVGAVAVTSLTPFPGIVKMEPRRFEGDAVASGHCGATRISESWFLTAAHCVDDPFDEIQFIAGTTDLRNLSAARFFKADTAICHDGYAGFETNFINDIALVRVPDTALAALTEIPIAEYGIADRPLGDYHYDTADMAGWGITGFNQPLSPMLLSAELDLVSASPGTIVVSSRNGSGPCIGDSGGPLYITEADGQRTVIGVLSVVEQTAGQEVCEGDYRGRYTNVLGYTDWIDRVTTTCDAQPTLCAPTPPEADAATAVDGTDTDSASEPDQPP